MSLNHQIEIFSSTEHGTIARCQDTELADQFEDFLTENTTFEFVLKFEGNIVTFIFGESVSTEEVAYALKKFQEVQER
jgi:hypothetical protein